MLNKEEVTDFGLERHYPSTYSTYLGTTLTITTLGLQFWVKKKHFKDGKLVVSCSATIPHIYNRKSDSYVVGRLVKTVRQLNSKQVSTQSDLYSYIEGRLVHTDKELNSRLVSTHRQTGYHTQTDRQL